MKKVVKAANDPWSRSQMSDDLDVELNEIIELANEFATRANKLADMGLVFVPKQV